MTTSIFCGVTDNCLNQMLFTWKVTSKQTGRQPLSTPHVEKFHFNVFRILLTTQMMYFASDKTTPYIVKNKQVWGLTLTYSQITAFSPSFLSTSVDDLQGKKGFARTDLHITQNGQNRTNPLHIYFNIYICLMSAVYDTTMYTDISIKIYMKAWVKV